MSGGVARPRLVLLLLFVAFLAPLTIAWVMNFLSDWHPSATTEHGELIQPPRPLDGLDLAALGKGRVDAAALHGVWTLVYLGQGDCDSDCQRHLYELRQVRLAQGKNIDRVRRLVIWGGSPLPGLLSEIRSAESGFEVGLLPSDRQWPKAFGLGPGGPAGRIYLVDPLGNLMMSYPPEAEPKGMVKDLERLLRISYVG